MKENLDKALQEIQECSVELLSNCNTTPRSELEEIGSKLAQIEDLTGGLSTLVALLV